MKKLKNSNCEQTQKTQIVTNLKTQIVTKLKNSNYDKTEKLKFWQNWKPQTGTKPQKINCDKTQTLNFDSSNSGSSDSSSNINIF